MPKRIRNVVGGVAALAALALGGSMIAQAATPPVKAPVQSVAPSTEPTTGPDTDNVQSGDQTTPDAGKSVARSAKARSAERSTSAENSTSETSSESATAESTSESATAGDGPGGHADEAAGGNANANHDFQGSE